MHQWITIILIISKTRENGQPKVEHIITLCRTTCTLVSVFLILGHQVIEFYENLGEKAMQQKLVSKMMNLICGGGLAQEQSHVCHSMTGCFNACLAYVLMSQTACGS